MHPLRGDLEKLFGQVFSRACADQTLIQHALLACDLETYRLDHGRYPERLQNSGSPAIIDSMTGQPFVYRITTDSSYLLYSVGADATDDGGKRSKQDFYAKKDWVW
jgi:ethanolamine transporter EutH